MVAGSGGMRRLPGAARELVILNCSKVRDPPKSILVGLLLGVVLVILRAFVLSIEGVSGKVGPN